MTMLIKGIKPGELLRVFEYARIGANDCTIGRGVIVTELLDHGDLIDRDAFRKTMYHDTFEIDSDLQKWEKCLSETLSQRLWLSLRKGAKNDGKT